MSTHSILVSITVFIMSSMVMLGGITAQTPTVSECGGIRVEADWEESPEKVTLRFNYGDTQPTSVKVRYNTRGGEEQDLGAFDPQSRIYHDDLDPNTVVDYHIQVVLGNDETVTLRVRGATKGKPRPRA